jgi:hypothetical protein
MNFKNDIYQPKKFIIFNGKKYKLLRNGEIIKESDIFNNCDSSKIFPAIPQSINRSFQLGIKYPYYRLVNKIKKIV